MVAQVGFLVVAGNSFRCYFLTYHTSCAIVSVFWLQKEKVFGISVSKKDSILNVLNLNVTNFILVLVQIDLIKFKHSNCICSILTKTNTNLLHSNLIHSILHKIRHVILIVVHLGFFILQKQ